MLRLSRFGLLAALLAAWPASALPLAGAIQDGARHGPAAIEAAQVQQAARQFSDRPGSSLPSLPQVTVLAGARSPHLLPVGPEVSVTVMQELAARGLGSARKRAAEWSSRVSGTDLERARLEGAAAAALAWVDLLEAQELLRLRGRSLTDAMRLAQIAGVRVKSGVATAFERSLSEAEVGVAELAVLDAEGRATEARLALTHATGHAMDEALAAEGDLERTEDTPSDDTAALTALPQQPALRAAEARAQQAAAESRVLRAALGPTFSVGAQTWREGSGDTAAAAIVSVPLPFFDPARYDTARQELAAATARSHVGRLARELEREIRLALHDRRHTREQRAQLIEHVVAPLRRATATAEIAYAAGTSELGAVLLARRSALGAEEKMLGAMADVWRADLRLAALTGRLLGKTTR